MRVGIPLLRVRTPLASTVKNASAFVTTTTISDYLLLLFISFQIAELQWSGKQKVIFVDARLLDRRILLAELGK